VFKILDCYLDDLSVIPTEILIASQKASVQNFSCASKNVSVYMWVCHSSKTEQHSAFVHGALAFLLNVNHFSIVGEDMSAWSRAVPGLYTISWQVA